MKKLVTLLGFIILAGSLAFGQGKNCGQTAYCAGNINADAQIVYVSLPQNTGTVTVTVGGTFSATLQIEDTSDGSTWNAATGTGSTTAPGTFTYSAGSFVAWRVRASAFSRGPATVNINSTPGGGGGGGGGTPGSPDLSIQGNSGGSFVGIPNSSFDASTGDVTLGARFNVNSSQVGLTGVSLQSVTGILLQDSASGEAAGISLIQSGDDGITLDTTNGTGPINLTSAGGVVVNNSDTDTGIQFNDEAGGIYFTEIGEPPIQFSSRGMGGIIFDAGTFGTGPINLFGAGGINLTAQAYPTFAITAVDQGTKTFTIAGDKTALTGLQTSIVVAGSTGNNGTYTVVSLTLNAGNTDIVVSEAIPNATADGTLTTATQAGVAITSVVPVTVNSVPLFPRSLSFGYGTPGGTPISTGVMGYVIVPTACTIKGWSILVDAGTATVTVWKVAAGTAIPTVANTISTSGLAISTGTVIQSTTLTDFTTTAVAAGDIIAANISAASGVGFINFQLTCDY